jgi:hypothetical protein
MDLRKETIKTEGRKPLLDDDDDGGGGGGGGGDDDSNTLKN